MVTKNIMRTHEGKYAIFKTKVPWIHEYIMHGNDNVNCPKKLDKLDRTNTKHLMQLKLLN